MPVQCSIAAMKANQLLGKRREKKTRKYHYVIVTKPCCTHVPKHMKLCPPSSPKGILLSAKL